ncbi:hypothetical protein MRX96_024248 [Rhipicephalus microplus]
MKSTEDFENLPFVEKGARRPVADGAKKSLANAIPAAMDASEYSSIEAQELQARYDKVAIGSAVAVALVVLLIVLHRRLLVYSLTKTSGRTERHAGLLSRKYSGRGLHHQRLPDGCDHVELLH